MELEIVSKPELLQNQNRQDIYISQILSFETPILIGVYAFTVQEEIWYARLYLRYALVCPISCLPVHPIAPAATETANVTEFENFGGFHSNLLHRSAESLARDSEPMECASEPNKFHLHRCIVSPLLGHAKIFLPEFGIFGGSHILTLFTDQGKFGV